MGIISILFFGALFGLIGAFAMTAFMLKVSSSFGRRVDMIRALGSYFTGKVEGSRRIGEALHAASGMLFGILYCVIIYKIGAFAFPYAIFLGIGFGFFHGLFMSYMLMFYASEKHPIKEYQDATLEQGLLHLVGHIIFGAVIGLLGALLSLII